MSQDDFARKQDLMAKDGDGFEVYFNKGKTKDSTFRAYYKEFRKVVEVCTWQGNARSLLSCFAEESESEFELENAMSTCI